MRKQERQLREEKLQLLRERDAQMLAVDVLVQQQTKIPLAAWHAG